MSLCAEFLSSILGFVQKQDGATLRAWLRVDSQAPAQYFELHRELKETVQSNSAIYDLVVQLLPEGSDSNGNGGAPWLSFLLFMRDYLQYWRDVNFDDLPALYSQLSSLLTWVSPYLCRLKVVDVVFTGPFPLTVPDLAQQHLLIRQDR